MTIAAQFSKQGDALDQAALRNQPTPDAPAPRALWRAPLNLPEAPTALAENGMKSMPSADRHRSMQKLLLTWVPLLLLAIALHSPSAHGSDLPSEAMAVRAALLDRLLAMPDVAAHKWNTGKPVEDKAQEIRVIEAAVQAGAGLGLPAETVRPAITAQIEAAKLIQQDLISEWQARSAPPIESVPDLASEMRPRIARATKLLITGLATAGPHLRNCDAARAMRARPEAIAAFPRAWDKAADGVIAALGGPDRSVCKH